MRVSIVASATVLIALASLQVAAVPLGYITGNDYRKLADAERTAWAVGAIDGLVAESVAVTKAPDGLWLGRCIDGVPGEQVRAIFDKYLEQIPNAWHAPAAFLLRDSMLQFCKSR